MRYSLNSLEETRVNETCHCLSCDRTEKETPLITLRLAGSQTWICPQCLPVLIHHADQLEDKLAALCQAASPNRAVSV